MEIFGVSLPGLLSQLLLGLVNGSFYAILSLGLAVIFGLLNVINFAHGALFMMGAVITWMAMTYFGIGYWWMLVLAPLLVGAFGVVIERLLLRWIYKLDHLYGLLLTLGLTLLVEGVFRSVYGVSGLGYDTPELLEGATSLGFMILPNYRAWVVVASIAVCIGTWYVIEKTKLGAYPGTTTCYRDIDVGKWHLVSSPIHGTTASIFKPATDNGYLRAYNNGVGWGGYFSSPYSQLAMGVGYAVYLENAKTATVSGNLNSGNITRSLTKGSNGWNLLGNPFASGLDFGQLNLSNAHLETNSVYFWNQSYAESNNGNYMVYNVTSGVGTSGATSVISPFQGFFVKITYNGSLELSNTARTHNLNAFYKSNSNTQLVTRLKISNSQGFKDEMLVCINDSSNNTYEAYDSEKLLAETNTPEIFAYASGGEKLTIDAINSYPAIIPLSVISPQSGILTLTAFDFSSFDPSVNIMLYDNQTSTIIDLRTQPSYTFSSDTGENNNRFFLHIGNTTGVNETVNNSFVSIRCEDKSINIAPFGGEKIMKIEIIDPTGKLLNSVKANGNEKTTIPANYTTGIYLIRIYGNHKMMTQKILLH